MHRSHIRPSAPVRFLSGPGARRRWIGAVLGFLALAVAADRIVLSREARPRWMSRLPTSALGIWIAVFPGDAVARHALGQQQQAEGSLRAAARSFQRAAAADAEYLPAQAE